MAACGPADIEVDVNNRSPVAAGTLLASPKHADRKEPVKVDPRDVIAVEAPEKPEEVHHGNNYSGDMDDRQPSYLTQFLLCCISALEGADTQLLGACMKALQDDVGVKITDIGYMTVSQAVCTNLAAPFWGILADRGILQRRTILLLGAMGQGLVVIALAFVNSLGSMIFLRALNGILLASLRPISNGIIADVTSEQHRGKVFGRVQSALLLGMFVTTMTVVPMATETVLGFQGWRVAFVLVGLISAIVSLLVTMFMVEPPPSFVDGTTTNQPSGAKPSRCDAVWAEIMSLVQFFKMPTFCVMIMQGIFGTIPWSVMGYNTLFFQLTGMENGLVSILTSAGPITGAFGNVIGGLVSDGLSKRLGLHGRPLSAQITVALGIPLIYLTFQGIPVGSGSFGVYFMLNILFGVLGSWAQSGTNFPILSHIVPASARSRVMAWECAFENSIANAVGPTVVGWLATANGYSFGEHKGDDKDLASADALGQALACTVCIPWAICFFAYSLLHWSYPRDIGRLEQKASQAAATQKKETEVSI
mmetsp:Transcript_35255/g.75084  ORF Transcript_35255/g.75084 Transcript_35255/m.75084 type:complete len:534 (-) Transcript_35255:199-1800(-)|eukprot:CAMPEP_0206455088 /NCGR_PEP_ID=MMETSP0324_2-20121206/21541_1 /ASSEMBLY_ACC=CAM_ASM_000836 /TAXON_ID=2866 /ORGANISM="Crypthecodinium cohnii, Strain Seligo" /LENGTH=533 /DNA_ID=CAMNT_0053925719 /DNA_START=98 /DNA_END=1699 /DNA_ORIENTATION=-